MRKHRPEQGLGERVGALERATSVLQRLDPGVLPTPEPLHRAQEVVQRAGRRADLSTDHTVVAFAGATGSGKSSLLNAVSGTTAATVGARRPTTSAAVGVWAGNEPGAALLDWLEVRHRHTAAVPDGLVLVDLPDVDSVHTDHHRIADRLIGAVDVLVWVLDPQKYADAVVHTRYLRPMAQHAAITVVVLNQVDLLSAAERDQVLADLRRLLQQDRLGEAQVLATSATTGTGITELQQVITRFATARSAAHARLSADVTRAATDLAATYPPPPATTVDRDQVRAMHAALARAAGVEQVADTVAAAFRHRARTRTGWPPTRWLRRLRPDPLQRLRLPGAARPGTGAIERPVTTVTSRPDPDPAVLARVQTALADIGRTISAGAAEPWYSHLRHATAVGPDAVAEALDATVVAATPRPRPARWWQVVGAVHWALLALLGAGVVWLTVLAVAAYLQIPTGTPPHLGPIPVGRQAQVPAMPWPTALTLLGLIGGWLLAGIARLCTRVGARRRRTRTIRALTRAVGARAQELVSEPVRAALHLAGEYRQALDRALPGDGAERPRRRR